MAHYAKLMALSEPSQRPPLPSSAPRRRTDASDVTVSPCLPLPGFPFPVSASHPLTDRRVVCLCVCLCVCVRVMQCQAQPLKPGRRGRAAGVAAVAASGAGSAAVRTRMQPVPTHSVRTRRRVRSTPVPLVPPTPPGAVRAETQPDDFARHASPSHNDDDGDGDGDGPWDVGAVPVPSVPAVTRVAVVDAFSENVGAHSQEPDAVGAPQSSHASLDTVTEHVEAHLATFKEALMKELWVYSTDSHASHSHAVDALTASHERDLDTQRAALQHVQNQLAVATETTDRVRGYLMATAAVLGRRAVVRRHRSAARRLLAGWHAFVAARRATRYNIVRAHRLRRHLLQRRAFQRWSRRVRAAVQAANAARHADALQAAVAAAESDASARIRDLTTELQLARQRVAEVTEEKRIMEGNLHAALLRGMSAIQAEALGALGHAPQPATSLAIAQPTAPSVSSTPLSFAFGGDMRPYQPPQPQPAAFGAEPPALPPPPIHRVTRSPWNASLPHAASSGGDDADSVAASHVSAVAMERLRASMDALSATLRSPTRSVHSDGVGRGGVNAAHSTGSDAASAQADGVTSVGRVRPSHLFAEGSPPRKGMQAADVDIISASQPAGVLGVDARYHSGIMGGTAPAAAARQSHEDGAPHSTGDSDDAGEHAALPASSVPRAALQARNSVSLALPSMLPNHGFASQVPASTVSSRSAGVASTPLPASAPPMPFAAPPHPNTTTTTTTSLASSAVVAATAPTPALAPTPPSRRAGEKTLPRRTVPTFKLVNGKWMRQ